MKLHLCNGDVYLKDYINIDINPLVLSSENKEQAEYQSTTLDNYYKSFKPQIYISDIKSDIQNLPFQDCSVDEVVMIQCLEHFKEYEVDNILREVNRVLKLNGKLYIAVPDIKGFAKLLNDAKTQEEEKLYIRYIYGSQKNKYSHHYCGYTKRSICNLLRNNKFCFFDFKDNFNMYPSIHVVSKKVDTIIKKEEK